MLFLILYVDDLMADNSTQISLNSNVLMYSSFQYSSHELDLVPYNGSAMNLDTFLADFKLADEWEVINNTSSRVSVPREEGSVLMFSRRTSLRSETYSQRGRGNILAQIERMCCSFETYIL